MDQVEMPPELLWDYREPPADPLWRLQRLAEWFPAFGRDRATVGQLHARRRDLRVPPEVRTRHLVQSALLRVDGLSGWPETEPPTTLGKASADFRQIVRALARSSI